MRWPWADGPSWNTLRGRLALWNTAVVLLMAAASLLAARFAARAALYDDADAELRAGVRECVLALEDLSPDLDAVVAEIRRKARSQEARGWFVHFLTEEGQTVWKSDHCPDAVANFPPHNLDREENVVQVGPYRYVRLRVVRPGLPVYHVRVGTYTTGLDESLSGLVRLLMLFGLALSLLTPLIGWWLAVRATQPVAAMLQSAQRLSPTAMDDRLPVRGTADELDTLAVTINRLLDEVADHVDRKQRFVADAAHELRGPLAAIQSLIDVALSQERPAANYRETLVDVLEETGHLSKLTNDLLTLAEAGEAAIAPSARPVDLAALAKQSAAMFAGAAEERRVAIDLDAHAPAGVRGDAAQLRRVIGNLLDNAIRHTPPGGRVLIRLRSDPRSAEVLLEVSDTGIGIAPEHIDRIFDRFYKIDAARSRDESGRSGGLGLPICKALVEAHGGVITAHSRLGAGTTVTIRLPQGTTSSRPA